MAEAAMAIEGAKARLATLQAETQKTAAQLDRTKAQASVDIDAAAMTLRTAEMRYARQMREALRVTRDRGAAVAQSGAQSGAQRLPPGIGGVPGALPGMPNLLWRIGTCINWQIACIRLFPMPRRSQHRMNHELCLNNRSWKGLGPRQRFRLSRSPSIFRRLGGQRGVLRLLHPYYY
jgi:hypothetical protein